MRVLHRVFPSKIAVSCVALDVSCLTFVSLHPDIYDDYKFPFRRASCLLSLYILGSNLDERIYTDSCFNQYIIFIREFMKHLIIIKLFISCHRDLHICIIDLFFKSFSAVHRDKSYRTYNKFDSITNDKLKLKNL